MEVESHLIISERLGYIQDETLKETEGKIKSIGMMLNRLIQSLKKYSEPRNPNS